MFVAKQAGNVFKLRLLKNGLFISVEWVLNLQLLVNKVPLLQRKAQKIILKK